MKVIFKQTGACLAALGLLTTGPAAQAQSHGTGLVFSPPATFARYPHLRVGRGIDARPPQFVLNAFLPPVGDQGKTGSCVGWSTAYYCYSYSIAQSMKLTPDQIADKKFEFSPAFIWDQFNGGDPEKGMHINEAFDVLSKQGCATMQEMPWSDTEVTRQPDDTAKARAARFRARQTVCLVKGADQGDPADPEKLKTWLWETKTPFVVGMKVFDDINSVPHDPDYVYTPAAEASPEGGHAICIIGYSDTKHAFRMINSWGPDWGDKGGLWLSEDYVKQNAMEAWGQKPGGPRARGIGGVEVFPGLKDIFLEPVADQAHPQGH
jgi:C1A family cysteine protease